MNIIVTCGPSYEPIDQVRRITNFSTGRLGITLANTLEDAGHRVFCLKGEQATDATPVRAHKLIPFSTNDDLAEKLHQLTGQSIGAVFHAAALCDFKVAEVQSPSGKALKSAKFATRGDHLTLKLVPTAKVLPRLRGWFPNAKIVGWKYELTGTREEAIAKAIKQLKEAKTDACILNGAAYGSGFLVCDSTRQVALPNLAALCTFIKRELSAIPPNPKQAMP